MDDPKGYKQSKAAASTAQTGMPPVSASVEPSPAKLAKKAKTRSSEDERKIVVTFPAEGSTYSDPSFVNEVTERMLLPADRRRLNEIGHVKTKEWRLAHTYQVCRLRFYFCCAYVLNLSKCRLLLFCRL